MPDATLLASTSRVMVPQAPGASRPLAEMATAAETAARDRAMLAAHAAGRTGDRIVVRRFRPAVSVGCHQTFEHEARRQYCDEAGVQVVRRPTAGGALYLDEGQQAMSLVVPAVALG
ncbi:MAG: hypothetical protein WCA36_21635, partial [Pseudolabrys sp.]